MLDISVKYVPREPIYDIVPPALDSSGFNKKGAQDKRSVSRNKHHFVSTIFKTTIALIILFFVIGGQKSVFAPMFFASSSAEAAYNNQEAALRKELEAIEAQIAQYEQLLTTTQKEKDTLNNKVKELKNKAAKLTLQIKATNIALSDLNVRIDDTVDSINKTQVQIGSAQENLSNSLQALYQTNQRSLLEILLSSDHISEYFNETNALNMLQDRIQGQLEEVRLLKVNLDSQKTNLEDKQDETKNLLSVQMLQKQDLDSTKQEQEKLLEVTKGKESQYQQVLTEQKKKAAELRNRIYDILGIKNKVTFGEALDIATWVGSRTGIREAFLLAILTQESNLGKNVGTCNRVGDPPSKGWQVVMRPDSREPFLQITKELGLDPNTTPISCPMSVGWGGAMGPAQFMPKTWMGYKDKIAAITGKNPPNPWDIRDAFVAAALYVADKGATAKTYDAEWRAAMIYFSGTTNTRYRFYGDNVMSIAAKYEADIAAIRAGGTSMR